jgi:NADH-quinone oxidoreductase subunit L
MENLLFLIPLLPLLAFVVNGLVGRFIIRANAHWVSAPAVFISWVLSVGVLIQLHHDNNPIHQRLFTWIPAGDFNVVASLYADQLTAVMLVVVTTIGLLVHIYSIGYMQGDDGYYRFFAYLPLFVFSMLMLVLADNLLVLFVFWEAVGICSYLLIGYYFRRRSAINAAKKAFIVNRIGDVGFGIGIIYTFWTFKTINFYGADGIFADAANRTALGIAGGTLTAIGIFLFIGAMGKSALFPLHVWLPDAMEGPTPVSALIHAATMVTAGIYMVARTHVIYMQSETAMLVVALIGAFTAFMAATIAITQNDIKRVIAYSTLSQLGYMAFALGTGAWVPAIFHLMTHAFFKALLFLGAGSVIHGMHDEQDIRKMGGLKKYMPITFWTFLVGSLANAGVIPFAGFWSKDEIISSAWVSDSSVGKLVAIVGLVTAFLTAVYMFRLFFLVFLTKPRFNEREIRPHESGRVMTWPLILLAVPTILIGFVGFPPDKGAIHDFLEPVFYSAPAQATEPAPATTGAVTSPAVATHTESKEVSTTTQWTFGIISTILALGGIWVAWMAYVQRSINVAALSRRFSWLYDFLLNKWYWDEIYDLVIVKPLVSLARLVGTVVEIGIIDASVNGVAYGIGAISQRLRRVQTGLVANYAFAIALGMILLVGIYIAGFSNLLR